MLLLGFVDHKKGIYNAAAVIQNKKIAGIYHKMLLPNYGVFDEKRYFKEGDEYKVFSLNDINFGVTICEDIWFEEGPVRDSVFCRKCRDYNKHKFLAISSR